VYKLSVRDVTPEFIRSFFPNESIIKAKSLPYSNNVIFKNIVIYGYPGSGKTTLANSMVEMAVNKYGSRNVNARMDEDGGLGKLIDSLDKKLVNILFSDNTTLVKQDKKVLSDYFKMRNIYKHMFDTNYGYILSIIALHRYHGIPIELRTCLDGIIFRDTSLNPYDRRIIEQFTGDNRLIKVLNGCIEGRIEDKKLMNISIFVGRMFSGLLIIPPSSQYLFKEPLTLLEMLEQTKRWR